METRTSIWQMCWQLLLTLTLVGLVSTTHAAEFTGPNRDANGKIIPTPKGDECIRPIDEMRKNHMDLLLHKRDLTMHQGIRSKDASLVGCINCHATPGKDSRIARIHDDNSTHFCASCHIAAAVKIDCFECHADRPVEAFSGLPATDPLTLNPHLNTTIGARSASMEEKIQ